MDLKTQGEKTKKKDNLVCPEKHGKMNMYKEILK